MKANSVKNIDTFRIRKSMVGVILLLTLSFNSCNEKEFLDEVPLDFYSPENSYVTFNDFESAVMNLYGRYFPRVNRSRS